MLYYLVRLIDPLTHEIKFWSLDQKVKLPNKLHHKNFPECILEIKTGTMSELKRYTGNNNSESEEKKSA